MMKISPEEAIRIITDEQLYIIPYNWLEERRAIEDEVGIIKQGDQWQVYTASERANPSDIKGYDVIEEALDDFVQRLRAGRTIVLERLVRLDEKDKQKWLSIKDRIYQMIS